MKLIVAGINTDLFKAHSARPVSTSKASVGGRL